MPRGARRAHIQSLMYSTTEPLLAGVIGAPASVQTISCWVFVLDKKQWKLSAFLRYLHAKDLTTGWFREHITLVHV